ncbi:MAG: hypothetical protein PVSMB7_27400 [Chloroflexota bacterium]
MSMFGEIRLRAMGAINLIDNRRTLASIGPNIGVLLLLCSLSVLSIAIMTDYAVPVNRGIDVLISE